MKIFRSSISSFFVLLFFSVLGFWIPQLSFAGRAGKMMTPRISHTATLIDDGGCWSRAACSALRPLPFWTRRNRNGRAFHTTTRLLDEGLLLAGGVAAVPGRDHIEPHAELLVRPD